MEEMHRVGGVQLISYVFRRTYGTRVERALSSAPNQPTPLEYYPKLHNIQLFHYHRIVALDL